MTGWPTFSISALRDVGQKARRVEGDVTQNCGDVADTFEGLLIDELGLPYRGEEVTDMYGRRHVRVGPNGEEKHYVFQIDGVFIEGQEQGTSVWIDLSFDQFNDANREAGVIEVSYGQRSSLETVRILSPDDSRRQSQYQTVGAFLS